jgi:phage terminase small subunit
VILGYERPPWGYTFKVALPPRQQRFVDEYLVDLNGTQAAIRSGYSPNGAEVAGSRLLRNAKVAAALAAAQRERAERTTISQDHVLRALASIAFSDIRKLFDDEGNLLAPHEIPDDMIPALASLTIRVQREDGGASVVRIRMGNKIRALTLLGKHLGVFKEPKQTAPPLLNIDPSKLANLSDDDVAREIQGGKLLEMISTAPARS